MDNFQAYGEFARVYDMFQDNVDYQTWGKWLKQQLAAQGITDGLVLDLGCGTGTLSLIHISLRQKKARLLLSSEVPEAVRVHLSLIHI